MKIEEILENEIVVSCDDPEKYGDLINHYVLFNDQKKNIGEIVSIKNNQLIIFICSTILCD